MFPIPKIPLDVVVIIAKYCIEDNWKMTKTFYSLCKKLQKKPYIKQQFELYKQNCVTNFMKTLAYFSKHDYVNNMCIILNINGIEHKITRCERPFDLHFHFYKNEDYMWKIIVDYAKCAFLYLFAFEKRKGKLQHVSDDYIHSLSWIQWHGKE